MESENMATDTPPELIDLVDEVDEDDNGQECNTSTNSSEGDCVPASGENPGGDGGEVYVKSLERKVKEQQSQLQDYQRQLQEERAEHQKKLVDLEEIANCKELLLTRQLEFEKTFTGQQRSKIVELKESEEEKWERIQQLEDNELILRGERDSLKATVSGHKNLIEYLKKTTANSTSNGRLIGLEAENTILKMSVRKLTTDRETEKGAREKLQMDYNELELKMAAAVEHVESLSAVFKTPTGDLQPKSSSLVMSDRRDSCDGPSSPPETSQERKLVEESGTPEEKDTLPSIAQKEQTTQRGQSELRTNGNLGTSKSTGSPRGSSGLGGAGNMDNVAAGATTSTLPDP